ncbi:MAG: prepilin-type N-terminal cleavage/methylation domain-containing protein [Ghiorsea sp.]|nr:prepilin-type N-terminal cleavage/methylation domain-containing protein [Ghiorsea sp.]
MVSLNQRGFTLVEVLISIVVAMTILGGLMLMFISQSGQYKYQNKRIDTTQDLEFSIKFIASDLRSALIGGTTIDIYTGGAVEPTPTLGLQFKVWDKPEADALVLAGGPAAFVADANIGRVTRSYAYDPIGKRLGYDREGSAVNVREILSHITYFKVFEDTVTPRAGFLNIPNALPPINVPGPDSNNPVATNGYTVLIEVEVMWVLRRVRLSMCETMLSPRNEFGDTLKFIRWRR